MTANEVTIHLPDEIISEILSPALRVSDEAFAATTGNHGHPTSPFMTFTESTSALLVVCKSWLRVATPLLYHVVILRSKAQAQALAATLKANPELGGFIRKLRAEGGYAISMFKILQASTKITDLFLCVDLSSADNACGFCKGLHLLDPVRIILTNMHPWGGGATKNGQKLVEALEKCVRTWKKLAVFQLDHTLGVAEGGLATALSEAPNLSTVVVSDHRRYLRQVPEYMRLIAKNPALKLIRLDPPANYALDANPLQSRHQFYNDAESDNTLSALLDLANLRRAVPAPDPTEPDDGPSIPFVYPARLAADPVQEDVIWSRVLYFALCDDPSIPRYVFSHSSPVFTPLLVCKLFQRIGTPHLYESPFLSTEHAVTSFASRLATTPLLGSYVRCLTIGTVSHISSFKTILANTPTLAELRGVQTCPPMTWKAFSDLGESNGSILTTFHGIPIPKHTAAVNPAVFAFFTQIQSFEWNSNILFKIEPKLIAADTFSLLVHLTVTTFDDSFLNVLSQMELPSLQIATFSAQSKGGACFFEKHGPKLRELTLSVAQLEDSAGGPAHP